MLPFNSPDALPDAVIPFAHVAENVPASEVDVWLVTCHENPVQLPADTPATGEDHVPIIEVTEGAGVVDDEVGASIEEF